MNELIENKNISIDKYNGNNEDKLNSQYYCYILFTANPFYSNQTYNGSTNNLTRRLRQHNGELVGGAKSTSNKGPWDYLAVMSGFGSHKEALSCEWRIKHPTGHRVRPKKYCGIEGRIKSLNLVLNLEKWTNNSTGLESGNEYTIYLHNEHMILIDLQQLKQNIKIKSIDELVYKQ